MGKHESGYVRVPRDLYPTPSWVTAALIEYVDVTGKNIWEPACGNGRMSEALITAGAKVYSTDIADHGYAGLNRLFDFTAPIGAPVSFDGVITNPPFGPRGKLAEVFIDAGLRHINGRGFLALLLPAGFDSAKTRRHLFDVHPWFAAKIVLTRRVKWFEHPSKPNRQPKENSAWFLWGGGGRIDCDCMAWPPIIRYAP